RRLGIGAGRTVEIGKALGIRTAAELREAALAGRLRSVPGVGVKTEAKILAALEREPAVSAARPLSLSRARALLGSMAAQLGGVIAGAARRWLDIPTQLAVAVATSERAAVRERFARLPEIVALAAPDLGLTTEGLPVGLVAAPPASFGT